MSVWSGFWIGIYCRADSYPIFVGAFSTTPPSDKKMNLCYAFLESYFARMQAQVSGCSFPCSCLSKQFIIMM